MSIDSLNSLRKNRLREEAKNKSGIKAQIKAVQRELVKCSFGSDKNSTRHTELVDELKKLRQQLSQIS